MKRVIMHLSSLVMIKNSKPGFAGPEQPADFQPRKPGIMHGLKPESEGFHYGLWNLKTMKFETNALIALSTVSVQE